MVKIRIEDIVFFIFIGIIVGTALWLMSGSPPEINAIITIGVAVAGSELLIWKTIFKLDKKASIGFIKVKSEIEKFRVEVNNRFNNIDNRFDVLDNKLNKIEGKL